jgi:hypothetical protein
LPLALLNDVSIFAFSGLSEVDMKPMQFHFRREWNSKIKEIRNEPKVVAGMQSVWRDWLDLSEFKKEEETPHDPLQAEAEFQLDILTFKVKHWDQYWLAEWTRGSHYVTIKLVLGIAETLFPNMTWEVLESGEYMIVSDVDRTMVFDFLNFDNVSAAVSLLLAGDKKYSPDELDLKSAAKFKKQENDREIEKLSLLIADIEFFDLQQRGNVIRLK